ncbi:MAG: T9SS type A sorting domain-containing protein, partial [Bacteroidales bacterium]|nr:T9SS type A sorting domain-containing protein [Bacteroidales bacterium]
IGNSVDDVQYNDGEVVMESGSQTSVLASEKIVLKSGTKIHHGAQFSAKIGNFNYCDESNANYVKSYNLESYGSDETEPTENDFVSLVVDYSEPVIMYPNPVDDRLYVSSNKTNNTIAFYDVSGKKVLSQTFHKNTEIDCSQLPVGTYVVRVVQGNGNVETKQIFKQ